MMTTTQHTVTVDAAGKRIGRVATEVAAILLGKDRTDQVRYQVPPVQVTVINAAKLAIDEKKRIQKEYDRYTGYPGGRRVLSMEKLIDKKGYSEVLRKAVYGMLPGNKLRAVRMKNLTITE